jgi:hypothetical protein
MKSFSYQGDKYAVRENNDDKTEFWDDIFHYGLLKDFKIKERIGKIKYKKGKVAKIRIDDYDKEQAEDEYYREKTIKEEDEKEEKKRKADEEGAKGELKKKSRADEKKKKDKAEHRKMMSDLEKSRKIKDDKMEKERAEIAKRKKKVCVKWDWKKCKKWGERPMKRRDLWDSKENNK